jgi:predicted ATP-grasp superfamily ATP-dependent carboligase
MSNIFLIGGCHHNILGAIRSLGEKGIFPDVILETKQKHPYVAYSRYIGHLWKVSNEQEVLHVLRQEAGKYDEKPVVVACADNLSSLLDMHYEELSKFYKLPGSMIQGRITYLMDKEVMSQLARKTDFLVPRSVAISTKEEVHIEIPQPWIIKPLLSKDGHKSDIERIYTDDDWVGYCLHHDALVQIQQLIDKDFEYQLIGLSLNSGKEVIIPGYSYVIRPSSTTNTGFLHYMPLDDSYENIVQKGKQFLKATGYSGLFSLEFLRGKDGHDYFMEINFRNDGNAICVTAAGVNLPYIWYLYNTGGDYHQEIANSKINPVYVMPEFADISLITHGQLRLWTWLKDIRRTDRYMEFDKHDKAPFFSYLLFRIRHVIEKRLLNRLV